MGVARLRSAERWWLACGVVAAFAFLSWGIATPSLWYDEIATLSASARSYGDLLALTSHVDAVHGAYYTLMHGIVTVFGADEFSLRMPSAVCAALATGAVYVLARRLASISVATCAALLFLFLPRTTWMAVEARSFALFSLLTVLAAIVWVHALTARRRLPAALAYGVIAWLLASVYLFSALVIVAQLAALVIVSTGRSRRRKDAARRVWPRVWPLMLATGIAAAAAAPLAIEIAQQRGQLGGTRPFSIHTPAQLAVEALFLSSRPASIVAMAAIVVAVAALVTRSIVVRRRRPREDGVADESGAIRRPSVAVSNRGDAPATVPVATLLIAWTLVPPMVLVGVTAVGTVVFQPRQLTMIAPAACIGTAILLFRALPRPASWLTIVTVAAVCAPVWWFGREPDAKGTDWRTAASALARSAEPGDATVFSPSWISGAAVRYATPLIPLAYRDAAAFPQPALIRTPDQSESLFGERVPLARRDLSDYHRIWLVTSRAAVVDGMTAGSAQNEESQSAQLAEADRETLQKAGFRVSQTLDTPLSRLELWTR